MKQTIKFIAADGSAATVETGKKVAVAALIGRFDNGPFRVISIHARADLAKPEEVFNERWTEVKVALRTE
jgi:hypothetical protein